jgi:hypothetical protein
LAPSPRFVRGGIEKLPITLSFTPANALDLNKAFTPSLPGATSWHRGVFIL